MINEHDKGLQVGREIIGTVVDIGKGAKEADQDGRVQVKFVTQQESGVTDEQLVWCQISQSPETGSFRDIGTAGHQLVPGTTVMLKSIGQQNYMITYALRNENKNPREADADFKGEPKKLQQKYYDQQYAAWQGHPYNQTKEQSKFANFTTAEHEIPRGDPVKWVGDTIEHARRFLGKDGLRSVTGFKVPDSIAALAKIKGDLLNATKYIDQLLGKAGELIPQALRMTQELQKKAKAAALEAANELVGGSQLVSQALAGISQMVSQATSEGKKSQKEVTTAALDALCALYEEITGLNCSFNGVLTKEFLAWKKEAESGIV